MLCTLIQGMPSTSITRLLEKDLDPDAIMLRAVKAATQHVTSNDELVSSVDGIECVMIESMYHNNAGSLRRAWLVNRRAMGLAQMLGLHAGLSSLDMFLDSESRTRIYPDHMWFRIVTSDRYLSLILGLPQGSPENTLSPQQASGSSTPLEHMERMEAVAGGWILQRNSAERLDSALTHKIDQMLQKAASLMPPQWWMMTPDRFSITGNISKASQETIRVMFQFAHQHLLVQLYLPYVVESSASNPAYVYGKITAANASREILARFVAFRSSMTGSAYCRGVDFISFIAATVLCLIHIEARGQQVFNHGDCSSVLQSLQHQQLGDRGLLERTLEFMESKSQTGSDPIAQNICSILKPLLAIDLESAVGTEYRVSASANDERRSERLSITTEAYDVLHIEIPHFGAISIRQKHFSSTDSQLGEVLPGEPLGSEKENHTKLPPMVAHGGFQVNPTQPQGFDWQAISSYLDDPVSSQQPISPHPDHFLASLDAHSTQTALFPVPGLDDNDWALQGVDVAMFRSLSRSSARSNEMQPLPHM